MAVGPQPRPWDNPFGEVDFDVKDYAIGGKMVTGRAMLSESLQAVISQTLLKKNGGGRVAAHEIMIGIPAIRNLIRENKVAQMYSAIQTGANHGMTTLDQSLKGLVSRGVISPQTARTAAKQPESFL